MSTGTRKIKSDLRDFAGEVMRELQARQTVQSFNGALKVNHDRVVISEAEGRRAIEKLRQRLK